MDDYERTNAQEWDLNYKGPRHQKQKQEQSQTQTHIHEQHQQRLQTHSQGQNHTQTQSHVKQSNVAKSKAKITPTQATPHASRIRVPQRQKPVNHRAPHVLHAATHNRKPASTRKSAWEVAEGVKRREDTRREAQPLLVDVGTSSDNAAEVAWRNHERPVTSISVPVELVWRDQQHDVIAKKFGTFVFSDNRVSQAGMIQFDIWGEPAAVKHTRQAMHDWVQREAPSKNMLGENPFWKQRSQLPHQRYAEEKKWNREVERQRFRQCPPIGTQFGAIGTFHWPAKEIQPHEVLGNSYEAFDSIRMECSCYVVFDHDIPAFKVMGKDSDVKAALLRIRKVFFQITAHQIAPVRRYFVHIGEEQDEMPSHVTLESYEVVKRLGPGNTTSQVPEGCSPRGHTEIYLDAAEHQQRHEMSVRDARIAGKTIMLVIAKLHYYRGHLKLRIRLGTFLVREFMRPDDDGYTFEAFKEMIQQSQFAGEVTPELGSRYSETTALETLTSADFLLDPRSSMDHTLRDVKPIYTAVFTIADNAGDLRLEISWHEVEDHPGSNKFELVELSRVWTRLDRGTAVQASLIDISLLNLKNSSAWHFELSASHAVENNRLAPEYHNIANSIRADIQIARQQRTDRPFIRWNPYAPVKTLQQRTSYLFALKNSNYTLELTRFQDRVYTKRTHSLGQPDCQIYEPRWSVEVYHSMWDPLLTRNEHLAVGAMVDWDDGVKTWFPEDDDPNDLRQVKGERGFEQLVAKLGLVEKLVLRSEAEMFGGMEVG